MVAPASLRPGAITRTPDTRSLPIHACAGWMAPFVMFDCQQRRRSYWVGLCACDITNIEHTEQFYIHRHSRLYWRAYMHIQQKYPFATNGEHTHALGRLSSSFSGNNSSSSQSKKPLTKTWAHTAHTLTSHSNKEPAVIYRFRFTNVLGHSCLLVVVVPLHTQTHTHTHAYTRIHTIPAIEHGCKRTDLAPAIWAFI